MVLSRNKIAWMASIGAYAKIEYAPDYGTSYEARVIAIMRKGVWDVL